MGYQESWLYVEPQRQFNKLIRAYEKAEQEGYYEVAGAQPRSVVILKQPIGGLPAGAKVLWVCGDRCFHTLGGIFGGKLRCMGRFKLIPVDEVIGDPSDRRLRGIRLDSSRPSENEYMKRYSAENYAYRLRMGLAR